MWFLDRAQRLADEVFWGLKFSILGFMITLMAVLGVPSGGFCTVTLILGTPFRTKWLATVTIRACFNAQAWLRCGPL